MRMVMLAAVGFTVAGTGLPGARAQGVDRYVEAPTGGVALPTTPLAGEHDARAVTVNPGGLALVRGRELALALDVEDAAVASGGGQGLGAYWAQSIGGRFLPRLGVGIGVEWLRPPRERLVVDPAHPFRATFALAIPFGARGGAGLAWHHVWGDGAIDGADAFDLGLSLRLVGGEAVAAVVRDVATASIGGVPVPRRYEAELVLRPLGTDRFEAGLGGRIGEERGDLDGWLRASVGVARGVTLHGVGESRALRIADAAGVLDDRDGRELRGTLGLELSFGALGATSFATAVRDDRGRGHALGGGVVVRASSVPAPSLIGAPDHIERVELAGAISTRELTDLVVRLRAIARDPSAKAMVVTFDAPSAGWATLEELRNEVLRVRAAGKKVFAYMVWGSARDYYVASAADRIYLDPAGGLRLVGMAGTTMYFRGAFDLLGVLPQFERIAEYKSAPEQFTETGPTPTATRMRGELFDSLWQRWLTDVAAARKLDATQLGALVDGGPYSAGDLAADTRLIDAVAPPDKISELITRELGRGLPLGTQAAVRPDRWQYPGIAVIYVDGDITDGRSRSVPVLGQSVAGGETLISAVIAARSDPQVAAIVIRIDSPGGSALASEFVAREVFATRGVKPVICSMSDVAASGGYFIAAGCDTIFAQPMTITGSIGIFSGKFDLSGLAHKLGVTVDTYKRGKRADLESMFRTYTDEERAVVQDKLRYMYGRFVGAVAEGRGMKRDEVDAVGRGHVWSGTQAMPNHLIDQFGGLGDAIDEAKRRAGLSRDARISLHELPALPSSLLTQIAGWLGVAAAEAPAVGLGDLPVVEQLLQGIPASVLVGGGTPQARLPFDVVWE